MIAADAIVGNIAPYADAGSYLTEQEDLIRRSQAGDVEAFNVLVERYQQRLYAVCYRMLGDAEEAADAVQESLLSAYRGIRHYRGGSFAGWLMRTATNECYDQLRARSRRAQISLDAVRESMGMQPRQLRDRAETPPDRALRNELAREIQVGLQQLTADQRLVVILSDIQGYSYDEIAGMTGWRPGTVKSRLSRGRMRLRSVLSGRG